MSNAKHIKAVPDLPALDPATRRALDAAARALHRFNVAADPDQLAHITWHGMAEAEREQYRLAAGAVILAWREAGGPL